MRFPDDVPVLTDGGVTLRAHREGDLDGMYTQSVDPVSQRFTSVPVPYTRDDARAYLESRRPAWEDGEAWSFAVESPWGAEQSGFSGSIGLRHRGSGLAEIGFGAHPDARGHGVMTRAVRLITSWAFDSQGLHAIGWETIEGNVGSLKVAWKTGFAFEGSTRARLPRRGEHLNGWRATLLATDSREPKNRWLDPVPLSDGRVRLRALRLDDETRYIESNDDPESLRWLGNIPFPHDSDAFCGHLARGPLGSVSGAAVEWAIADVEDDRYLGTLNFFGMTGLDYKSAEVGYRTHPDARGRGVLKSSLNLALGHAFASEEDGGLGLERVSLNAGDGNLGSQGVARTCGFTETGRDRQNYDLYDGSVVDLVRFDILKSEFDPRP